MEASQLENKFRYGAQTVVVTGAGSGLDRAYAIFFASRGAKAVVNDVGWKIKRSKETEMVPAKYSPLVQIGIPI